MKDLPGTSSRVVQEQTNSSSPVLMLVMSHMKYLVVFLVIFVPNTPLIGQNEILLKYSCNKKARWKDTENENRALDTGLLV